MNPLSLFPQTKWIELGALALAIAAIGGVMLSQHNDILTARAALAVEREGRAQDRAITAAAAASAATASLTETGRRIAAQGEIANESERLSTRARADADGARVADVGLRSAASAAAARCGASAPNSAVAAVGASASAPGLVLADVLSRIDDRAGELAELADRAIIAGKQCERSYDALNDLPAGSTPGK